MSREPSVFDFGLQPVCAKLLMPWSPRQAKKRSKMLTNVLRHDGLRRLQAEGFADFHGYVHVDELRDVLTPYNGWEWTRGDITDVVASSIRDDGTRRFQVTYEGGQASYVRATPKSPRPAENRQGPYTSLDIEPARVAAPAASGFTILPDEHGQWRPVEHAQWRQDEHCQWRQGPSSGSSSRSQYSPIFPAAAAPTPSTSSTPPSLPEPICVLHQRPKAPPPGPKAPPPSLPKAPPPSIPKAPPPELSPSPTRTLLLQNSPFDSNQVNVSRCVICHGDNGPPTHGFVHQSGACLSDDPLNGQSFICHVLMCETCLIETKRKKNRRTLEHCPACRVETLMIVRIL